MVIRIPEEIITDGDLLYPTYEVRCSVCQKVVYSSTDYALAAAANETLLSNGLCAECKEKGENA